LRTDPKSAKKTAKLSVFFVLLGSVCVKAACKMLVKLTLDVHCRRANDTHFGAFFRLKIFEMEHCFHWGLNTVLSNIRKRFATIVTSKCADPWLNKKYPAVRRYNTSFNSPFKFRVEV